jgi:SPP1 gp7 family putative phage head morphogenesis protein
VPDAIHIDETIETLLDKGMNLRLTKADPLDPDDFVLITERVAEDLQQKSKAHDEKAVAQALAILLATRWNQLTPTAIAQVVARAAAKLDVGSKTAQEAAAVLSVRSGRIVQGTKESLDTLLGTQTAGDWREVDQNIANFSRRFQRSYIQEEYRRRSVGLAERARAIVTRGLEEGRPVDELKGLLTEAVESYGLKRSKSYWSLVSTEFANRARISTQLNAFEDAGIEEYLWDSVLDERTTDYCRAMHGTVIQVSRGRALLDRAMVSDDPDAIKEIIPWVRERRLPTGEREMFVRQAMGDRSIGIITRSGVGFKDTKGEYRDFASLATLEAIGIILPPAHAFCRSTIIPVL